jgi:hypothetical protein
MVKVSNELGGYTRLERIIALCNPTAELMKAAMRSIQVRKTTSLIRLSTCS